MKTPTYIKVRAGVRYWDDATVNGKEDEAGSLIPHRVAEDWCPTIRLTDGKVMDWPQGVTADVHYKVCDAGEYWLLDEDKLTIAKWAGFYVPDDFLCHGDTGYGDYIIFKIDADGRIQSWRMPEVVWACECDNDDEQSAWKKTDGAVA